MPDRDVLNTAGRRARVVEEYFAQTAELRQELAAALRRGEVDLDTISVARSVAEAVQRALRPDGSVRPEDPAEERRGLPVYLQDAVDAAERKRHDHQDVETVLTTASNTFNLPNVITVQRHMTSSQRAHSERAASGDPAAAVALAEQQLRVHRQTLSEVPDDETPEEKKLRQALVKQMQRDARVAKKDLKLSFAGAKARQSRTLARAQKDKTTASLSVIRSDMKNA